MDEQRHSQRRLTRTCLKLDSVVSLKLGGETFKRFVVEIAHPKAPSVIDEIAGRKNGGGSWKEMETIWSNLVVGKYGR